MLRRLNIRNPRTGLADYAIDVPPAQEIAEAALRLRAGQSAWAAAGASARAAALLAWRAAIERRVGDLTAALAIDTGRKKLAEQEVGAVLAMIGRLASEAPALLESAERPSKFFPKIGIRNEGVPFELVGCISPWNFPLLLALIDAIPALLAGSAVFIKPSEVTPRFVAPLRETIGEVPALAAVLDIMAGDGETGVALIPNVDVVAFTGSVATGRKVAEAAARAFIPAFLELGGKDPAIVFEDADIERAATALLRASVIGTGQACQSIERIYVARAVFDPFVRLLTKKAQGVSLTYPDPKSGIIGPLIFERQGAVIAEQLRDAREKGAVFHSGGEVKTLGGGLYVEPTVLTNVRHDMKVMSEETFGPILPVMPFDTEEEAERLANDSIFGLSACVFSGSEERALGIARRLNAGGVSINDASLTTMVFEAEKNGFRLSGLGPSRMGPMGLLRFLRQKAIYLQRGPVMPIEAVAES